ncbi:MAG TPA: rRNA adenine N-6-methyltransferase family protein, partial [Planctomycetota bacterium]|nr:rRNA adenine N-6-methyltransferase family protein [Planctomycetota bacterium]
MDWLAVVRGSGLRPSKALGQSFIVHQPTLDAIVAGWEIGPEEEVFEIGTGPGTLTAALASRARRVWTVELDGRWAAVARRTVTESNVVWIEADALQLMRQVTFGQPMRVVGNLPYSSYRDMLLAILEWPSPVVDIGLTLQEDVVAKLTEPGPLAVLVGSAFD